MVFHTHCSIKLLGENGESLVDAIISSSCSIEIVHAHVSLGMIACGHACSIAEHILPARPYRYGLPKPTASAPRARALQIPVPRWIPGVRMKMWACQC